MNLSKIVGALAALILLPSVASAAFVVTYEGEAPGVQSTTATFSTGGVETFDSITAKKYPATISTTFGTNGAIQGLYTADTKSGIQINTTDQYGGAGGNSNYIVAFPNTPYTLDLTSNIKGGVNYFGFWLSALDQGNTLTFSDTSGKTLFVFNPKDVINAINTSKTPKEYYGNPTANFKGQDGGEPFVFINFFDQTGSFSKITFSEVNYGGGYESDNHTVGHYLTMGQGYTVPLTFSVNTIPEPAPWALLIVGVAGVGGVLRHKRKTLAT